jgi:Carboxypeptidase regulatory-like domain
MKTIALLFAACAFITANSSFVRAQESQTKAGSLTATGKVIGPTAQPQAGVPVTVQGPSGKTYAITDDKGAWSLYNLPAGKYEVQPFDAYKSNSNSSVTFTVKEKGLLDKWLSSEDAAYVAPEMKISRDAIK